MFQETLRRIARNVEAVRNWAPGMRVTGCLVFVTVSGPPPRSSYDWGRVTIRCFGSEVALMRELKAEAHSDGGSFEIARRVWRLGKVEVPQSWEAAHSVARQFTRSARKISRSVDPFWG